MTLGPKFFFCNKMTTARRPMDLFEIWKRIQEAGIEIYNLAVSKHDLKPSATFFRKFACDLGFAAYVFHGLFAPGGRLNYEAYNVRTIYKHKSYFWCSLNMQNIIRRSPQASPTKNWKIKSAVKEKIRDLSSSSKIFGSNKKTKGG